MWGFQNLLTRLEIFRFTFTSRWPQRTTLLHSFPLVMMSSFQLAFFLICSLSFYKTCICLLGVLIGICLCKSAPQINRSAGGSDMKLRVSLENLLAAEQVGRWWIVGSSWSGAPMISKEQGGTTSKQSSTEGQVERHTVTHTFKCIRFIALQTWSQSLPVFLVCSIQGICCVAFDRHDLLCS